MSKIDLSKAKFGDKFRTKYGQILEFFDEGGIDTYKLMDENYNVFHYHKKGNFLLFRESDYDLIEQVFDKPLDELIKEATKQIKENNDAIAEEKELQRRQEVVELARKMLFDDNTYQFYTQFYIRAKQNECAEQVMAYLQYVMDYAEDCVNKFNQYLKEGKLC